MKNSEKNNLNKAWQQYESGKEYKRRISLYETVRTNERFYRGEQWQYGEGKDLPKPVFNIVYRIINYLVCSVASANISLRFTDENLPFAKTGEDAEHIRKGVEVLTENTAYRWKKNGMDRKMLQMLTDAATKGSAGQQVLIGIVIVTCYVAGASLVMWLGEKINEKGIGNGISLILFCGIVSSIPSMIYNLVWLVANSGFKGIATGWAKAGYIAGSLTFAIVVLAVMLALTVFVVWITGSERRIPIQYAKRVVGRKMYGGQNSTLPIKLNMSGVMPVIFASSIVSLPATILTLCRVESASEVKNPTFWNKFYDFMAPNNWFYPLLFIVLIILFSYFYITISFKLFIISEFVNNISA